MASCFSSGRNVNCMCLVVVSWKRRIHIRNFSPWAWRLALYQWESKGLIESAALESAVCSFPLFEAKNKNGTMPSCWALRILCNLGPEDQHRDKDPGGSSAFPSASWRHGHQFGTLMHQNSAWDTMISLMSVAEMWPERRVGVWMLCSVLQFCVWPQTN